MQCVYSSHDCVCFLFMTAHQEDFVVYVWWITDKPLPLHLSHPLYLLSLLLLTLNIYLCCPLRSQIVFNFFSYCFYCFSSCSKGRSVCVSVCPGCCLWQSLGQTFFPSTHKMTRRENQQLFYIVVLTIFMKFNLSLIIFMVIFLQNTSLCCTEQEFLAQFYLLLRCREKRKPKLQQHFAV